jgi:large conductance mechanosensitive channel
MSLVQEFKEFAMKGNVLDMAVGIIIGAAFGKIVSALVGSVLMPVIGMALGGVDFSGLSFVLGTDAKTGEPVALQYGLFLQALLDFLIIAFAIFMALKGINKMKRPPAPAPVATTPPQEVLLTEIRDLLKQR